MNPQDQADFSTLKSWHLSTAPKKPVVEKLLSELQIKASDVLLPTSFMGKLKVFCFGPHYVLPTGGYPDVIIVASKKGLGLAKYVKQQSPATYVISISDAHQYADLCLTELDLATPAAVGLVRGHLLRHLTARL